MKKQHIFLIGIILTVAIMVNLVYYFNRIVTVNFYAHPDKLNVMTGVIEKFEKEHPKIKINYVELPDDTNDKYEIISAKLALKNGQIDVFDADVTWPSVFVKAGWVADLSGYLTKNEQEVYLSSAIDAATINEKLYGIPYRIDSGVLFFRKDLLEKYQQQVPKTYEELVTISKTIMKQENNLMGFAASWKNFEGLSCHFFEMFWSAGYEADTTSTPYHFDALGMTETLQFMQNMLYVDKVVSEDALTYSSGDLRAAFIEGKLIFMRDWPTGWRKISSEPSLKDKVGIAPLPSLKSGNPSYGAFGGWLYMVAEDSANKKESVEWIKYLTTTENEKLMNLQYNYIPSRKELFKDPEVLARMPFLEDLQVYFNQSKPRPKVANYDDLSLALQSQVHLSLQNKQTPDEARLMLETLLSRLSY